MASNDALLLLLIDAFAYPVPLIIYCYTLSYKPAYPPLEIDFPSLDFDTSKRQKTQRLTASTVTRTNEALDIKIMPDRLYPISDCRTSL
jgi:hypothetical protein